MDQRLDRTRRRLVKFSRILRNQDRLFTTAVGFTGCWAGH